MRKPNTSAQRTGKGKNIRGDGLAGQTFKCTMASWTIAISIQRSFGGRCIVGGDVQSFSIGKCTYFKLVKERAAPPLTIIKFPAFGKFMAAVRTKQHEL